MSANTTPIRLLDNSSIFIESGVATQKQVSDCLKKAISDAEKVLGYETNCKFKINLIVDKDGKYFGFGYIRVSNPKIYWMLLGRNPDGSERIEEQLDPNWKPPVNTNEGLTFEQILEKNKNKTWFEIAQEEDSYVQPKIKIVLPPLITIPGFEYDEEQIAHLKELAIEKGESENAVPKVGFFELSRAYSSNPERGFLKNRLCARNVPNWVPEQAFKSIFSMYVSEEWRGKLGSIRLGNKEISDTYPIINFVDAKNKGRIVFVTFPPETNDAIFAILMMKKTRIVNPKNPNQKTTLIFMHAFDNQ
jgi:hypothetical protein